MISMIMRHVVASVYLVPRRDDPSSHIGTAECTGPISAITRSARCIAKINYLEVNDLDDWVL